MNSKILVTGASGNVGTRVASRLLDAGASVRVAVRNPEKAAALAARGAEGVRLDWDDPATYDAAFAGVKRVFLLTPFVEHHAPYVERAVAAARAAGVEHLVRMSAMGADPSADGVGREHGLGEQRVKDSGIPWTVLQPTFFAENALTYQRPSIERDGAFYGASAGGRIAYVASDDIAEVAAAILTAPAAHAGQTYVLTGGEAITDAELAEVLTAALGRQVRYVDVPADAFAASLRDQGTPGWMVEHLAFYEQVKARGWGAQVQDGVERVLGRPPTPIRRALGAQERSGNS